MTSHHTKMNRPSDRPTNRRVLQRLKRGEDQRAHQPDSVSSGERRSRASPSLPPLRELHRHSKLTEEEEIPFFISVGCTLLRAHSVQSTTLRPIRRIVGALLCFQRPISVAVPWWLEWSELRERVYLLSVSQLVKATKLMGFPRMFDVLVHMTFIRHAAPFESLGWMEYNCVVNAVIVSNVGWI